MTACRPDPEEFVALDQPTATHIRTLLNGMALRWRDHQGVQYRVCDVVAAIAYVQQARTKAEQRTKIDHCEPCPFCSADTTRGWYADYCMVCGAEYTNVPPSHGA